MIYIFESQPWFDSAYQALLSHYYLHIISQMMTIDTTFQHYDRKHEVRYTPRLMYGYSIELLMKFMIDCKMNKPKETAKNKHELNCMLYKIMGLYPSNELGQYSSVVKDYEEVITWSGRFHFPNNPNQDTGYTRDLTRITESVEKREEVWNALLKTFTESLDQKQNKEFLFICLKSLVIESVEDLIQTTKIRAVQRIKDVGRLDNINLSSI
jgi:hypothetical protein